MMSKMKCFGLFAGCALATGALYATAPTYQESFEGGTHTWSGGQVETSNYTYSVTGSALPISGTHAKVLLIEGNASYTHSGTTLSGSPVVDMMVQTARPDDELGFPSSEDTTTIQIAVAVDSNGCFNAYCKPKTTNQAGWCKVSTNKYDAAAWARVSFLFDYSNNRCQIRIDGQPVVSEYGYLTAAGDIAGNGAWYTLAKDNSASVASMKVIGCTAIDDVVMNVDSGYTYPLAAGNDASGVPYSWYDDYGIAWTPAADAPDGSGMTVAAKYNACLSPLDGQTFAIKSVTTTASKAVVAIPATVDTTGRKVVLDYGTDPAFAAGSTTTTDVAAGATTVEIDLPAAGAVKYCRLRATAVSGQ